MIYDEIKRLGLEDLQTQLDAIYAAAGGSCFSLARAQMNGARIVLDGMERKLTEAAAAGADPQVLKRWSAP